LLTTDDVLPESHATQIRADTELLLH